MYPQLLLQQTYLYAFHHLYLQFNPDQQMQTNSNPQEFQANYYFNGRTTRNKLKPLIPHEISHYSIKQKLGMGSYAKVYKALHKATGQILAVKILNKTQMTSQQIEKTRFQVEIHKKLFHTNIVRIYEFFENDQKIYIFMELCQNGQLFNYINSNGPLSQKFAAKVFKQILSAMKYLKSQRIFHRDIKCQNIMFDKNWSAKLVDFGFVTIQDEGCFSRTFCGSPSYTAPELARRKKYNSKMIDIWCLGVTLYAMIAGQLPFDGCAIKETKKNILDLKYEMKKFFSQEVKQVFSKIFVEDFERSSIEDLEQMSFTRIGFTINPNFINTDTDLIMTDPRILDLISHEFNDNPLDIIQSVTKFKLDQHYSLYYMVVQRQISKGSKVKWDIASMDFQKKKKDSTTLKKLIKIRSNSRKKFSRLDILEVESLEIKGKKDNFRIRPSYPSVDVRNARLRKRDQSPESPKRILDLVSVYRHKI